MLFPARLKYLPRLHPLATLERRALGPEILIVGAIPFIVSYEYYYQHVIVKPGDLSRINTAFFTANGFVSVILAFCGIADVLLRPPS